jgi:hypothetical protein
MATAWKNPDVHAHTVEMRTQLQKEFQELPQLTRLYASSFDRAAKEIKQVYNGDGEVVACLDKMTRRKDVVDNDLCGVMPAGLLALVWEDKIKPNEEAREHFLATLKDMGTTCVQGDTHRLFATYVAFSRPC